eukprot:CAMPEP_0201479698 /NCGR_PEP_ID=MMETSP0151_2-20130828/4356_1 /ASSEMBLY_ACC=CAM_ASM_000257 /TAXON_ID=200890 /ORGANISM="Paramoeba atlantica, Strain 621/1 / CCAP 1560/9" /LENGTH=302 /DNA_ID=CAMNT_0047861307 /DNA_START=71 /DNA_END=979 /DNA_ORIENTATION=+
MADGEKEAKIIDGKAISQEIMEQIAVEVADLKKEKGVVPGLAVLLVGNRKDSQTYVRFKKRGATQCGFLSVEVHVEEDATVEQVVAEVDALNVRDDIHAILVQLPLPAHIDEKTILNRVKPEKDVDGFSAENVGNLAMAGRTPLAAPCTPCGIIDLLERSTDKIAGKTAVVIGRSNIVGLPVALMLMRLDATVTIAHSKTEDIPSVVRQADIVVVAVGRPHFVRGDWLKPGCVVIDVGINAYDDPTKKLGYRLVGDVDFAEAKKVCSAITPVPGGVGPMTIAMLMKNTLNLTKHSLGGTKEQ